MSKQPIKPLIITDHTGDSIAFTVYGNETLIIDIKENLVELIPGQIDLLITYLMDVKEQLKES